MAQGTFKLFNALQGYIRNGVVSLDGASWRVILCSNSVADLKVTETNPAKGSTNITEVAAGGGYTANGQALTLNNAMSGDTYTFKLNTTTHANGIINWSKADGSPTNIRTAVIIDDAATDPADAAIGFYDMTEDGSTAVSLAAVDIELVIGGGGTAGDIFTWTVN